MFNKLIEHEYFVPRMIALSLIVLSVIFHRELQALVTFLYYITMMYLDEAQPSLIHLTLAVMAAISLAALFLMLSKHASATCILVDDSDFVITKDSMLGLFSQADSMYVGHSPLLEHVDLTGPDDESVVATWDDAEGQESIHIPHSSLASAVYENGDFFVEDALGETTRISFHSHRQLLLNNSENLLTVGTLKTLAIQLSEYSDNDTAFGSDGSFVHLPTLMRHLGCSKKK